MDFDKIAEARYSVRKYSDKPIEEEKLAAVLEAGRIAPTAKNNQPQRIFVLKSIEAVQKIRSLARCAFDAPAVLLVCADTSEAWVNPFSNESYAQTDCAIVTTYMMLKASELGLSTCFVGWFDTALVKKEFGLPQNIEPLFLLPLGYASDDSAPGHLHALRKELSETVSFL